MADYTPGYDTEAGFKQSFTALGGTIPFSFRTPVDSTDFSAYLQHVRDEHPQAVMGFQAEGPGAVFLRQYNSRGLLQAGIKFLGAGDIVPEEVIAHGDAGYAVGTYSAQAYASSLDTPENHAFVAAYRKLADGAAPDMQSVAGYDAIELVALALRKDGGNKDGTALLDAMRGQKWNSPRGPISIGQESRDITQSVYVREFRLVNGKVQNVIIATYKDVPADPTEKVVPAAPTGGTP